MFGRPGTLTRTTRSLLASSPAQAPRGSSRAARCVCDLLSAVCAVPNFDVGKRCYVGKRCWLTEAQPPVEDGCRGQSPRVRGRWGGSCRARASSLAHMQKANDGEASLQLHLTLTHNSFVLVLLSSHLDEGR